MSLLQWGAVLFVYLVTLAVVSRLVSPDEIGLFAIGAALTGVLVMAGSYGAERYLVQARGLQAGHVLAAFGLSLFATVVAVLALIVSISGLVHWYGDARLAPVLWAAALGVAATPVHATIQGLLARDMRFGRLLSVNTGAALTGAAVSIALAAAGWGATGLAIGLAADAWTRAALTLAYCPAVPGAWHWPGHTVWRDARRFGGSALGNNMLTAISDAAPALLAGRMLGVEAVGLLNRSQRMVQLLQDAVQKTAKAVALPVLAAGDRTVGALAGPYTMKICYLSGFAWPAFLVIAILAGPVVAVVLGPQWTAAVPILSVMALGGLFVPFIAMNISFYTVLDRLDLAMQLQASQLPVRLMLVGTACWWGNLVVLALVLTGLQAGRAVIGSVVLGRLLGLPMGSAWWAARTSFLPAMAAALGAATAIAVQAPALPTLVMGLLLAGTFWAATMLHVRHPLLHEARLLRTWLMTVVNNRPGHAGLATTGLTTKGEFDVQRG